jgi:hypothetical protein
MSRAGSRGVSPVVFRQSTGGILCAWALRRHHLFSERKKNLDEKPRLEGALGKRQGAQSVGWVRR